jgi:uncharacterized protein (TIGR03435 family)
MPKHLFAFMLAAAGVYPAQAQPGKLEFEVASVKPAAPQAGGRIFVGRQGGPGTPDPGRVTFTNTGLKQLITLAYNLKPYQVTGPDWLDTQRFDVVAKIPPGSSKEQVNQMLQSLLEERFKLTFHSVTREFPLYELVVGKNGHKLKASVVDPSAATAGPDAGPGRGGPPSIGKDGFPTLPPGRPGMLMMMSKDGPLRIAANVQSMTDLANMLSNQIGTPVVDKTGLTGTYDFALEFVPERIGAGGIGGGLVAPGEVPGASPGTFDGPTIFGAVQDQLGLKLEQKKGPLEVMVIDRAERVPSEN